MAHALKGDLGTPLADRLVAGLPVIDGEADPEFPSTALAALRSELVALCTRHNRAGGGATAVDPEYLEVIAQRA